VVGHPAVRHCPAVGLRADVRGRPGRGRVADVGAELAAAPVAGPVAAVDAVRPVGVRCVCPVERARRAPVAVPWGRSGQGVPPAAPLRDVAEC